MPLKAAALPVKKPLSAGIFREMISVPRQSKKDTPHVKA
jgi:hypothetical protein